MKNSIYYCLLFFLWVYSIQLAKAQTQYGRIQGNITQYNGVLIEGVSVHVSSSDFKVDKLTNQQGDVIFEVPIGKTYMVVISHLGYLTQIINLDLTNSNKAEFKVKLKQDVQAIKEVSVLGKSVTQKAKDQIIKAQIIDTKTGEEQASTLVEMMNRSAGIRIRQSGGLGSNSNIMLNGFQGKSVKMFRDGIPTDYLGASFNLSNLPVSMLEHIEVYKGVLPTQLGADALGGAVNLVSKVATDPYIAASYEIASFQTHKLSLNLYQRSKSNKLFGGIDAFFNYSENSYKVTANIPDSETANVIPENINLFHNAYKQVYTELYGGLKKISWADELRLGLTSYYIDRQNQFASLMERPFGASHSTQRANIIPTLHYKKSLLDDKLKLDQFVVYSKIKNVLIDTLSGSYDWYGNFHPPIDTDKRGEAGSPSLATLKYSNLTTRTGLNYSFHYVHNLGLNVVFNDYNRSGEDPYGNRSAGENPIDLLSLPADYTKVVGTLGLTSTLLQNKLQNLFQIKYFNAHAVGQEINISTGKLKENTSTAKLSTFGFAEALKWDLAPTLFFRLSSDWATRLPQQSEIMGDGSYTLSNFDLNPERSINGNFGIGYNPTHLFGVEANSFYRITRDMILNVPVNLIYSQSSNVEKVRGLGLEMDAFVEPVKWFRLNGNFTYQDFRLYHVTEPSILYLEKARLRNIPYFFSNLGANFKFSSVLNKGDQIQAYWYFSYVHQYYLNYIPKDTEPDGFLGLWGNAKIDAPNIIPSQSNHTVGIVWKPLAKNNLSVNIECKNLLDAPIYDNFRIQNAGRSYHLKFNYNLKFTQYNNNF